MMQMKNLFMLHGFLGSPSDWSFLNANFPEYRLSAWDLFDQDILDPAEGLMRSGKRINQLACKFPGPKVLIGYSLGSRLALHALIDSSAQWDAAVLISGHPGLFSDVEKSARYESDNSWSKRFLSEPWNQVINDWNLQLVFRGGAFPKRDEENYPRKVLAKALTEWSLGKQDNLHNSIKSLDLPILWITGADDPKFTSIAALVELSHVFSKKSVIEGAGHRVPWDQQLSFIAEIKIFFNQINKRN